MRGMTTVTERTIDIEKILKGKMGAKAKFVPRPLVCWLKKIAHQDQVNAFLWDNREKTGVEWLEECVKYLDMTLNIVGKENLPDPNDVATSSHTAVFASIKSCETPNKFSFTSFT